MQTHIIQNGIYKPGLSYLLNINNIPNKFNQIINLTKNKKFYSTLSPSTDNNDLLRKCGVLGLVLNQEGKGGCLIDLRVNNKIITRSDYFKRFSKRLAATSLFLGDTPSESLNKSNLSKNKKKELKKALSKCHTIDINELKNVPLLPPPDADSIDETDFQFQLVKDALSHYSWKLDDNIEFRRAVISPHTHRVVTGGFIMTIPDLEKFVDTPINIINTLAKLTDEENLFQEQGYGELSSMLTLQLSGKRAKAVSVCRKISKFANQLAKHIVIFNPIYTSNEEFEKKNGRKVKTQEEANSILLNQKFLLDNKHTVAEALKNVGEIDDVDVEVSSFVRWSLK